MTSLIPRTNQHQGAVFDVVDISHQGVLRDLVIEAVVGYDLGYDLGYGCLWLFMLVSYGCLMGW